MVEPEKKKHTFQEPSNEKSWAGKDCIGGTKSVKSLRSYTYSSFSPSLCITEGSC